VVFASVRIAVTWSSCF